MSCSPRGSVLLHRPWCRDNIAVKPDIAVVFRPRSTRVENRIPGIRNHPGTDIKDGFMFFLRRDNARRLVNAYLA